MRITFVLPCFNLSGGIRVAAIYADKLHRRGHHVVAVAPCERGPTLRGILRSLIKERKWPATPAPEPSHFDGLAVEHRLLSHPAPVIEADVPDAEVVIATWWESAEWVANLSAAKGVKVHFMQGYETFAATPEEVDAVCRRPIPKIVISSWLRDIVRERFGQTPLALVPNAVDTDQFHAPPRGKQAAPTVGFSYSTQAIKGCDLILKAYHLAAAKMPGLRLVVISNCPISEQLPLPPGAELSYQARDQALRAAYSRCDAWLSGTREEGFGLPILEAMACRTPVIATPAGAAPELLAKGSGILVPHEDPEAMARAITEICSLPEDRWRMLSDAALATATGYSWDDATDRFEQALHEAVERARSTKVTLGNELS
jgi:glycosyltransferase involved in cell wall biosynthesis